MQTRITTTHARTRPVTLRRIGWTTRVAATLLAVAVGALAWRMAYAPEGLDDATVRTTAAGAYQVAYEPSLTPIPINVLHAWTLRISTPDGRPLRGAAVTVDGGMPQHRHGLATVPQVTGEIAPGTYLVEGMKFQMGGRWVFDVTVEADGVVDHVRFHLLVGR